MKLSALPTVAAAGASLLLLCGAASALQQQQLQQPQSSSSSSSRRPSSPPRPPLAARSPAFFPAAEEESRSRRSFLASLASPLIVAAVAATTTSAAIQPAVAAELTFSASPASGLQWADAKVGSGVPPTPGNPVTIDYVMSTTGARYGTKIYSTADKNAPYRWVAGDGTTIKGVELAVLGGDGGTIPPMLPGGVRRVIIPSKLGYETLAKPIPGMQYQDCQEGKGVGPIPPVEEGTAGEYYQRFKNIYCNANRPYQPELVMDIKLYGKRTPSAAQ